MKFAAKLFRDYNISHITSFVICLSGSRARCTATAIETMASKRDETRDLQLKWFCKSKVRRDAATFEAQTGWREVSSFSEIKTPLIEWPFLILLELVTKLAKVSGAMLET